VYDIAWRTFANTTGWLIAIGGDDTLSGRFKKLQQMAAM